MTLEEAIDLIYKKKETTIKIRTIRAKSDFEEFDLDKSLLDEYNLYIEYIKQIAPLIRDVELNNILERMFKLDPIEDWTQIKSICKGSYWKNLLTLFDKYRGDTIMTIILRTRCDNLKDKFKAREF